MARKKITQLIEDLPQNDTEAKPDESFVEEQHLPPAPAEFEQNIGVDQSLKDVFKGMGADESRITIHRIGIAGKSMYVGETEIEGLSEQMIQDSYGEGTYKLIAYDSMGKYIGSRKIVIGPPVRTRHPEPQNVVVQPSGPDPALMAQFEAMKAEQVTMREIMLRLVDKIGSGPEKTGVGELAEVMTMLKPVMQPPAQPSIMTMITEALPLVKQLVELGASGGSSKGSEGWSGVVRDLIQEVPAMLKNISEARAQAVKSAQATGTYRTPSYPPPGGSYPPPPVPQVQAHDPQPAPQDPDHPPQYNPEALQISPEQLMQLQYIIGYLKKRALSNTDPKVIIDWVMNTLDDEQSLMIAKLLDRPFDEIAAVDPEITSVVYRGWFEDFFGGLKDALSKSGDTAGDEGDDRDSPDDEGDGSKVMPGGPQV